MPRIAGINIPDKKPINRALTAVYGIGYSKSNKILRGINVEPLKLAEKLSPSELSKIREAIEKNEIVEGDLRRKVSGNIKLLKDLGTYRGTRHSKRLPARGQKTKKNARTVRGNVRRTVTSGRRKLEKT